MRNFALHSFQSLATIGKVLLLSKFNGILRYKKAKLENSIIILGNGPSLSKTILENYELIKKSDLLCVNNFASSDFFQELQPKYYIIAAPIFFQAEETLSKEYIDMRNVFFEAIVKKTTWDMNLMVPFVAKKSKYFREFLRSNEYINPLYFNTTPAEGITFLNHYLFKKGFGMPRPHNVLIPSIMNAIFLGFEEIKIVGADHSWLKEISVNEQNEALVHQKHFYDENESKPLKMQDYITRPRRLHEIVYKFYLTFRGYWDIASYAAKRNVKIINCSEESMIDAFERGKLN